MKRLAHALLSRRRLISRDVSLSSVRTQFGMVGRSFRNANQTVTLVGSTIRLA